MKKIFLLTIAMSIVISGIFSQTPQAFKYQAVARDNAGNTINNQVVSFRISILQGSASGTSMYSETHQPATNDFGLANLEIGSGLVVSGNISSIDWSTGSYFLKVEMDPAGGSSYQLMGASQLLSVPYALFAESTANPGDDDWTISGVDMYSGVVGNVGIGTATPSTKLEVAGRINQTFTGKSIFLGYDTGKNDDLTDNHNVFIGYATGWSNTTGAANIAIGGSSLFNSLSGDRNTALGYAALRENITGSRNTAIGYTSLKYNLSGSYNTAIGYEAGYGLDDNSTNGCIFIGYQAGYFENTDNKLYIENSDSELPLIYGDFSTDYLKINGKLEVTGRIDISNTGKSVFIGQSAGYNDDLTDNYNIFVGYFAGKDNTAGSYNIAMGASSLTNNTTGSNNSAIGCLSLRDNTEGAFNTAFGRGAMLLNTSGDYNIAIGNEALSRNVSGNKNTALGWSALHYTGTGNNNTAIGYQAGYGSVDQSVNGCVYLGYQAGYNNNSDNKLFIDNSSSSSPLIYGDFNTNEVSINGQMGIGTDSPVANLHVDGTSDASLSGGGLFVSGDFYDQNIVMDGNEIMARDNGASSSLHLQRNGGGLRLHYDLSELFQFNITTAGETGIGVTSPNSKLHVNSSWAYINAFRVQVEGATKFLVHANGGVVAGHNVTLPTFAFQLQNSNIDLEGRGRAYSWNTYSDNRLKSNQRELSYGLQEVMQLQPKNYDHHSSSTNEEGEFIMVTNHKISTVGFIAQEVQQVIPEAVCVPQDESKDLWSMDYDKLIPVLTKAIQEQQAMIEAMQLEIAALKSKSTE